MADSHRDKRSTPWPEEDDTHCQDEKTGISRATATERNPVFYELRAIRSISRAREPNTDGNLFPRTKEHGDAVFAFGVTA